MIELLFLHPIIIGLPGLVYSLFYVSLPKPIFETIDKKKIYSKNFSREKAVNLLLYFCVWNFFSGACLETMRIHSIMNFSEFYQIVSKFLVETNKMNLHVLD